MNSHCEMIYCKPKLGAVLMGQNTSTSVLRQTGRHLPSPFSCLTNPLLYFCDQSFCFRQTDRQTPFPFSCWTNPLLYFCDCSFCFQTDRQTDTYLPPLAVGQIPCCTSVTTVSVFRQTDRQIDRHLPSPFSCWTNPLLYFCDRSFCFRQTDRQTDRHLPSPFSCWTNPLLYFCDRSFSSKA